MEQTVENGWLIKLENGNEIHVYDRERWQSELIALKEARDLLLGTEVSDVVYTEIDAGILECEAFLKYGINADGDGPDYPAE